MPSYGKGIPACLQDEKESPLWTPPRKGYLENSEDGKGGSMDSYININRTTSCWSLSSHKGYQEK